jgi:AraC-like DNA-binding protein
VAHRTTASVAKHIQMPAPAREPRLRQVVLPIEDVSPLIRIAHRPIGRLTLPERVIFDHEFVLIVRGSGEFLTRAGAVPVRPHLLLTIPPFFPHAFRAVGVGEHIGIHFDFARGFPRFAGRPDRRPPYRVALAPDLELPVARMLTPGDGIEAGLIEVVRDFASGTAQGRLSAQARLALLVARLARPRDAAPATASAPAGQSDARLAAALALIGERFAEPLTMGDCARAAGMSPTRFAHRFRERTGYAPMEYLRRLRVERARRLLSDPSLSVKEVAARCGFPDQYHFSRVFRQTDGLPPSQYREAALAGRTPSSP